MNVAKVLFFLVQITSYGAVSIGADPYEMGKFAIQISLCLIVIGGMFLEYQGGNHKEWILYWGSVALLHGTLMTLFYNPVIGIMMLGVIFAIYLFQRVVISKYLDDAVIEKGIQIE